MAFKMMLVCGMFFALTNYISGARSGVFSASVMRTTSQMRSLSLSQIELLDTILMSQCRCWSR